MNLNLILLTFLCQSSALLDEIERSTHNIETPTGLFDSPQESFRSFATAYNQGDIERQLSCLSPKTKATLVVSHLVRIGMAPQDQQAIYSEHTERWKTRIEDHIEHSKLGENASTYVPLTIAFSDWDFLDGYLNELLKLSVVAHRPVYSEELKNLNLEEFRANAKFGVYTNGGLLAGLNGNTLETMDAGEQTVYFIRISNKWYICNEQEFLGEFEPLAKNRGITKQ